MKQSRMNGLVACLLSVAVAGSAMAGFDVDLGASFSIGDDDNDLYVAVSARYFDEDRHAVQAVGRPLWADRDAISDRRASAGPARRPFLRHRCAESTRCRRARP